ncbi:hypothetical protein COU61_01370 [Candidatus Pacearchaeota archaeon CG10_big_fil_rev_8_21_14_0_10_35_13]|nr:MAG: hypothetical protein COU61_01370 [Candidatus Pacearchaeota archaeon CG10_big_fil_rev_8_21_14_0_10_35_13]
MKKLVVKIISYALIIVGFVFLASNIGKLQDFIFRIIPFMSSFNKTVSLIIAGVLIVVGLFLAPQSGKKKNKKDDDKFEEVPIYEGHGKTKKVIGYKKD